MKRKFWLFVCRFAYRKCILPLDKMPMGLPQKRDPDSICENYMPIKSPKGKLEKQWGADCQGDGHYLCKGCALFSTEVNF